MKRAIILAAGEGSRLKPLTKHRPKAMVKLAGQDLIKHQINILLKCNISQISVVVGCHGEIIREQYNKITSIIENKDWSSTNMVYSFDCWLKKADFNFLGDTIVAYGDIVYNQEVLTSLLKKPDDFVISADTEFNDYWSKRSENPLDDLESFKIGKDGRVIDIGQKIQETESIDAQYIGLMKFSKKGISTISHAISRLKKRADYKKLYFTDLLSDLIVNDIPIMPSLHHRGWLEIDTLEDLQLAEELFEAIFYKDKA